MYAVKKKVYRVVGSQVLFCTFQCLFGCSGAGGHLAARGRSLVLPMPSVIPWFRSAPYSMHVRVFSKALCKGPLVSRQTNLAKVTALREVLVAVVNKVD